VLDTLAGWVDPTTGVICGIAFEGLGDAGDLPIVATAAPPHVVDGPGLLRRMPLGWGKGLTLSGAIISAVGEAIERYAASMPDSERIVWARPNDLDGEVLDPRTLVLYTDAQYEDDGFPYARFDPSVRHPWVPGRWLADDTPVWVPAVCVFLSLTLWPEHILCQGTSNGLAASTDLQDAALRATLELVERDAFLASWFTACPGRPVDTGDTLDPQLRRVVRGIESLGPKVELYTLQTSACGTTALCLALGDGQQWPGITIGLGADLDPYLAVRQAILELAQTGPYLSRMMRSGALTVPDDPSLVREMLHHAAYYFPADRAIAFDRLRSSETPHASSDLTQNPPERSLASCATKLAAAGVRVALVDVTSPDVATGPFRVVRAVSPDLQPIWYGYGLDRRPVDRIRALGLSSEIPAICPIW
jgi:thiazole/oxazole-forming peptide maturase SagD family component